VVIDAINALILETREVQHGFAHRLTRNGARIDARSAQDFALLDNHDLAAQLGGLDGRPLARWPGTDHDEVVSLHGWGGNCPAPIS